MTRNQGGDWIRSADAVDKDTMPGGGPKRSSSGATKVSKTPWAWDVSSGTFWTAMIGGGWKCPDDYPRRTANPVTQQ